MNSGKESGVGEHEKEIFDADGGREKDGADIAICCNITSISCLIDSFKQRSCIISSALSVEDLMFFAFLCASKYRCGPTR